MSRLVLSGFQGIDRRRAAWSSNPRTFITARNVEVTTGGGVRTRPGFRRVADLHSESVGLFSLDNKLASVVPAGRNAYPALAPFNVRYYAIGRSTETDYPGGIIERVESATMFGANVSGGFPYVVVRLSGGSIEHHWITDIDAAAGARVDTRMPTGFAPGPSAAKHKQRIWTQSRTDGSVRGCSVYGGLSDTQFGPRDWTEPGSAAQLFVNLHVSSQKHPVWLSIFNDNLLIFYPDAVQFWSIDADPALNQFVRTVQGPGTRVYGSVAAVGNDLIYFSDGGFTSLSTIVVTGEKDASPIGAPIADLTKDDFVLFRESGLGFNPWTGGGLSIPLAAQDNAVSLWSDTRSQYLCVVNGQQSAKIYVYTWSKVSDVRGWTTWEVPFRIDYLVENDGGLYARSGDTVYLLDNDYPTDDGVPFDWELQLQDLTTATRMGDKRWDGLRLDMTGECRMDLKFNPDQATWTTGPRITQAAAARGDVRLTGRSPSIGMRFYGSSHWHLDGLALEYTPGRV